MNLSSFKNFFSLHKYLITIGVFAVIMLFLDENNVFYRKELSQEKARLESEIERYRKEFKESTEKLRALDVDFNSIERIARENYQMKKPGEDIFVFEEDMETP